MSALSAYGVRKFTQPGPTVSAFIQSRARTKGIMGPQGGGKTSGVVAAVFKKMEMQPVSPITGEAYYTCTVWMRTYRELWAKFIRDWLDWLPKESKAHGIYWTGGVDNPAEQRIRLQIMGPEGRFHICNATMNFRAIGEQSAGEAAKGVQTTDFILPEATSATDDMRAAAFGRIGRYPPQEHGGAPFRQLMADWNAGDPYNWTSEFFVLSRTDAVDSEGVPLVEFFRQPGGRSANAENLHNLPPGYYDDQVATNAKDPDWIRRMVDNEIGFVREGHPVYPEFSDSAHVAPSLEPWPGVELVIAADGGLTPAAVIMQKHPTTGEIRQLDEVTSKRAGPQEFGRALMQVLDTPRYEKCPKPTTMWADPATKNATEASGEGEAAELMTWMRIVATTTGLTVRPSRCGNDLVIRTEGVKTMLTQAIGTRKAFMLDASRCPETFKALARDYRFKKSTVVTSAGVEYRDTPEKNSASHVANAVEYAAANMGLQHLATGKAERLAAARKAKLAARAQPQPYNPLGAYQ